MALSVRNSNAGDGFGQRTVSPQRPTYNPQPAVVSSGNFTNTYNPQQTGTQNYYAPKQTTQITTGGGGGGGGGGGTVAPAAPAKPVYVDPYAGTPFGTTANFNRIKGEWTSQRDNTFKSINDRVNNDLVSYDSAVKDLDSDVASGQKRLNAAYTQNELAKLQGQRGVNQMVGQGIRSAGVMLANKNASTSSAADAFARAYSTIGQRELTGVGNQYQAGLGEINMDQEEFNTEVATDARHLLENKTKFVNSIVQDAADKIAALNASAAGASLPDRIEIEKEKSRIRNEAMGKFSAYDAQIDSAKGKAKASGKGTWHKEATDMANAGVAGSESFDFTSSVPAEFRDTGPYESTLDRKSVV